MPGTRTGASSVARRAKELAAKSKRPASGKRKAITQPEDVAPQPASRTKAGKAGRGARAPVPAAANGTHAPETSVRASKRARIETPAALQLRAAKTKPAKTAKRAVKAAVAPTAGNADVSSAAAGKPPTSAASRKQAIRARAKAASLQPPPAALAHTEQVQPDKAVRGKKGRAVTQQESAAVAADAEQHPEPEQPAERDKAGTPATVPAGKPVAKRGRPRQGKSKGGKAPKAGARALADAAPLEPTDPAAAPEERTADAVEVAADSVPREAAAPEDADGDAAVVGATGHAIRTELHGGIVSGSDGHAVLANGHAHAPVSMPEASAHAAQLAGRAPVPRESIIRTRTGQILEQELAASRAALRGSALLPRALGDI